MIDKAWDASKHPRVPAGSAHGGEFGRGGGSKVQVSLAKNPKLAFSLLDRAEMNWHRRIQEDRAALVAAMAQAPPKKLDRELAKAEEEWASYLRLHGRDSGIRPEDLSDDHPGKPYADYILSKLDLIRQAQQSQVAVGKSWDEAKHPRGGDPKNHGRFSRGQGGRSDPGRTKLPEEVPQSDVTHETRGQMRPDDNTRDQEHRKAPSSAADRSPLHKSLEAGRMKHAKLLAARSNLTYLLDLEDGTQGVFKPHKGESEETMDGIPLGTGYRREVAASRLAELLGMQDLVPITTFREQQGEGVGSMQKYVADAAEACDVAKADRYDGPEDAARAAAFDYLTGNLDRHQGNWLMKDGKLVLIDNGFSLPTTYHEDSLYHMEFWRQAVKNELELPDTSVWEGKGDEIEKELRACGIEEEAVKLARQRFDALVSAESPRFSDLPGFFEGWNLGEIVNTFERRRRGEHHRVPGESI